MIISSCMTGSKIQLLARQACIYLGVLSGRLCNNLPKIAKKRSLMVGILVAKNPIFKKKNMHSADYQKTDLS